MAGLWSEEHDRLPLKQRLRILVAKHNLAHFMSEYNPENSNSSYAAVDVATKVEDDGTQPDSEAVKVETNSQAAHFDELDHVSLIERRRMLSREKKPQSSEEKCIGSKMK